MRFPILRLRGICVRSAWQEDINGTTLRRSARPGPGTLFDIGPAQHHESICLCFGLDLVMRDVDLDVDELFMEAGGLDPLPEAQSRIAIWRAVRRRERSPVRGQLCVR